jgi:hypothetical protein
LRQRSSSPFLGIAFSIDRLDDLRWRNEKAADGPGGMGSAGALVALAARGIAGREYATATSRVVTDKARCGQPQRALPSIPKLRNARKTIQFQAMRQSALHQVVARGELALFRCCRTG